MAKIKNEKNVKSKANEVYEFEEIKPIKGFPELHWKGKHPYSKTQYYPAQLKEVYGESCDYVDNMNIKNKWMNKIFWGDNLQVMSHLLKEYRGKVDLIYIDPPFDSKADYKKKIKIKSKEVKNDSSTFEEKQYGDIWANDDYLQFMYERLILLRKLLSDTGVIYVHCDHRKSAYLRCILDEIFGIDNFLNEITWRRQVVRGMKVYANYYSFSSDYILIYAKNVSKAKWYRQTYINYISIEEAEKKYNKDKKGYFRTSDPGSYTFESLCELYEKGRLYAPKNGKVIIDRKNKTIKASNGGKVAVKYYREIVNNQVAEEVTIDNIWDDIPGMGVVSSEFIGYPTQKPEALLERVIKASTDKGDLVFDCFMGSGTTQAVAMKLGRRFLGADINLGAIQTTTKRLINIQNELENNLSTKGQNFTGFEVYNVNNYDLFRNPVEAKDIILDALSVQKFDKGYVYDGELDGYMVKVMPINRIATKADLEGFRAQLPFKKFDKRKEEHPNTPVEKIMLVCMGHEPDLAAGFKEENLNYKLDIKICDILTDKKDLEFKREAEADVKIVHNKIVIKNFYPLNLLQKLSIDKTKVKNYKELVESVLIDFNYNGKILKPEIIDIPEKDDFVKGEYEIPKKHGKIKIKITDLLSESLEVEL